MTARNGRLRWLDGVRAAAASFVVLHHCWLTLYQEHAPSHRLARFFDFLYLGHFGVAVFIVVSGYSLSITVDRAGGWLPGGFWPYVQRRAMRILPTYYVAFFLGAILAVTAFRHPSGSVYDGSLPLTAVAVVLHVLLLQDVKTPVAANYPLWSIAVESQIYLLFPVLLLLCRRFNLRAILLATFVPAVAVSLVFHYKPVFIGGCLVYGYCFALGVLAYRFTARERAVRFLPATAVVGAVLLVSVIVVAGCDWAVRWDSVLDLPVGILTAATLATLGSGGFTPVRSVLSLRPVVAVGEISYSLYAFHALAVELVWRLIRSAPLGEGERLLVMLTVGYAVSVATAAVFYSVVEKRTLRPRQRGSIQQRPATTLEASRVAG